VFLKFALIRLFVSFRLLAYRLSAAFPLVCVVCRSLISPAVRIISVSLFVWCQPTSFSVLLSEMAEKSCEIHKFIRSFIAARLPCYTAMRSLRTAAAFSCRCTICCAAAVDIHPEEQRTGEKMELLQQGAVPHSS
jgi:hypothetical protein